MHVFYLAKALGERKGIRVHLFAPGEQLPGGDMRWFSRKRVAVHRTDFSSEPTKVSYSEVIDKCLDVYSRVTSRKGFDVYECSAIHGQHFAGLFVGLHLKKRFNAPLVVTLHKTPIGGGLGQTISDRDSTYAHLSLISEWRVDAFVAGSKFFSVELKNHGLSEKTVPINHGVPVQWIRSRADGAGARKARDYLGIGMGDDLITCPIRFDRRKNPEDLIWAAGKIQKELPNRRLKVLITGGDTNKLMKLAVDAELKDSLILKELPFDWLYPVLRAADICVVPTKREGLGLSVLEAMALQKPVVATDVEGIREVITNEVSGCLYADGQPEHLAFYLRRLLLDDRFRRKITEGGTTVVTEKFSHDLMADHHENLYRSNIIGTA